MFFNDDIIEEVRLSNDIVDVVNEYVRIEKKGKNYFGICPFHKEKTPSFSVEPSKQIFYCFGCGKGGNVIHFIMQIENLSFVDAVKFLAERARIVLPDEGSREELEKARKRREIININTEAARFFHENLKKNPAALRYLESRGIKESTIRKFGLGYSPEEWDSLYKYLKSKGFDERLIAQSGLVIPNRRTGGYIDRFRGRIMFPIFDIRSNVIAFGGRILDTGGRSDSLQPKYMNSPETCVYNKRNNLYALNFAKNSGEKRIIVVEGYMDVISLHQGGIINTVASLGTALTENQGRLLKKYAEEVIICYDADKAGQAATMRGLDVLDSVGCNVKVLSIPDGKDPDEFIRKKGSEALKNHIDNAVSLVEYKVRVLKKQINTDTVDGKVSFINRMADILSKVENRVEMELYVKKIAKEYNISEEAIFSEIYKKTKPRTSLRGTGLKTRVFKQREAIGTDVVNVAEEKTQDILYYERLLLALLSIDNRLYRAVKKEVSVGDFTDENNRKYAKIIFERLDENKGFVPAELLNILDSEAVESFVGIIQKECNFDDNRKAVMDIIRRMKLYKLDKRKEEILRLLSDRNTLQERDVEKLKLELNSIILKRKSL